MALAILIEEVEVISQLLRWNLPKDLLLDILDRAAGERAHVNSYDPAATGGHEMRRWLTRFLRESEPLKSLGWVACAHDQLEGIRNGALQMKLVALNTDPRAGVPSQEPTSVSDKGAAAERRIKSNEDRRQGHLFGFRPSPNPIDDYDFLYFCVHASDKSLSAEISRPSGMTAGFITNWSYRVMLSQPGERPGLRPPHHVDEDFAEIAKPTIIRKQ